MPRPPDTPKLCGLPNPNTTPFPNCIVDQWLPDFTGAELKVLLYLIRRTLGFHRTCDTASLNQICNGIVRKDGRRLDRGTGLSKSTVCDALNALIDWGMIRRVQHQDPKTGGDLPTEYVLWIAGGQEGETSPEGEGPGSAEDPDGAEGPGPQPRERRHARKGRARVLPPLSGSADTPLSGSSDTGVSAEPDTQKEGGQNKVGKSLSNIRPASPGKNAREGCGENPVRALPPSGSRAVEASARQQEGARGTRRQKATQLVGGATAPSPLATDSLREELHRFAEVAAAEFRDQAPFPSTLSRLVNLYHRAGLEPGNFVACFDAARQRTKERTGAIRTLAGEQEAYGGTKKNKMPYFFAILEELLGLREPPPRPDPRPGGGATPPGQVPTPPPIDEGRSRRGAAVAPPVGRGTVPARRPLTSPRPPDSPPVEGETDRQMIRAAIREFSRRFAGWAAADALGDWAASRWQESGLTREQFLLLTKQAAAALLIDSTQRPSAPEFQVHLTEALAAALSP